jgi:MerR family transcriptional regulator, heat shock protein HspR
MSTDEPGTGGFYMIGIMAELAGMHPQTLRLYERRGLIQPSRSAGRTRRYSDADLARLRRIQALSEAGLNIAGIERVLDLERQLEEAEQRLAALAAALEAERTEHREQLQRARRATRAEVVLVTRGETALVPQRRPVTQNRGR